MDSSKFDWERRRRRLNEIRRKKLLANEGKRHYSVRIQTSPDGSNKVRGTKFKENRTGRRWENEESGFRDDWWPARENQEEIDGGEPEEDKSEAREYINHTEFAEAALRELREATADDDGGLEKKLEELPPSFWKKVTTKLKSKAPLICSAFHTHELAVESVLMSYLNMVGIAAHKGIKKYCKIIAASGKVDRFPHEEQSENGEDAPKPTLLVRFFNFINARLESLLGVSSQSQVAESEDTDEFEDSKNLVFNTNKLNLILFPPSMDKVQKVIDTEDGERMETISTDELRGEFWKGSLNNPGDTPSTTFEPSLAKKETPNRECHGRNCPSRSARFTRENDWNNDDYSEDYYDQRRERQQSLRARHRSNQRKLQFDDSLDLGVAYDLNLLNPKISPDFPEVKQQKHALLDPDETADAEDSVPAFTTTEAISFREFEKAHSIAPQLSIAPHTEKAAESVIGPLPHPPTTAPPSLLLTTPVMLVGSLVGLVVLILVLLVLLLSYHLCARKTDNGDSNDSGENYYARHFPEDKRLTLSFNNQESDSEESEERPEVRRGPPTLQSRGSKKSRNQAFKDDYVPVGRKKKKISG